MNQVNTVQGKKRIPKQSWIALGFLWLIFAINCNARQMINVLTPEISNTFGLDATTVGIIGSVCGIAMAIGAIPISSWAEKGGHGWALKKRSFIIAIVYLIFTFLTGIPALTGSVGMLLFLQGAKSLFSTPGEACEVGGVAEWWPRERNGLAIGFHHTAFPWGTFFGGLLISFMLYTFGENNWRYSFFIFPILGLVFWFAYWKWATPNNYKKFEEETIAAGYTCPLTTDPNVDLEKDFKVAPGVLLRCLKNPNIMIVAIIALLCHVAYIGLLFWMTPYLTFVAHYGFAAAAGLSVIYGITGGLGQIFWGYIADKFGTKRTLLICCAWYVFSIYLMQYIGISLYWLVGLQLLFGVCSNAVFPVMYKYVAESSERGAMLTGNGIFLTGLFIGAAIATSLIGYLIQLGGGWSQISGYRTGIYAMCGCMVLAFILVLLFTRETNGPNFGKDFSLVSLKSCNLEKK